MRPTKSHKSFTVVSGRLRFRDERCRTLAQPLWWPSCKFCLHNFRICGLSLGSKKFYFGSFGRLEPPLAVHGPRIWLSYCNLFESYQWDSKLFSNPKYVMVPFWPWTKFQALEGSHLLCQRSVLWCCIGFTGFQERPAEKKRPMWIAWPTKSVELERRMRKKLKGRRGGVQRPKRYFILYMELHTLYRFCLIVFAYIARTWLAEALWFRGPESQHEQCSNGQQESTRFTEGPLREGKLWHGAVIPGWSSSMASWSKKRSSSTSRRTGDLRDTGSYGREHAFVFFKRFSKGWTSNPTVSTSYTQAGSPSSSVHLGSLDTIIIHCENIACTYCIFWLWTTIRPRWLVLIAGPWTDSHCWNLERARKNHNVDCWWMLMVISFL